MLSTATTSILDLLKTGSPLCLLLDDARSLGTTSNLSFLAPRIIDEINSTVEENFLEQEESVYNTVIYFLQRAKELGIPLQLWHLQNKIWRILETKSATPSRIVLALANELNFAVPYPN